MSGNYSMTPAAAFSKAEVMAQENVKIKNTLTELIGELNRTLSEWAGESQQYYLQARQQWAVRMDRMGSDLNQAASIVQQVANNVNANERNAAQMY